jgi:hypothetical protein
VLLLEAPCDAGRVAERLGSASRAPAVCPNLRAVAAALHRAPAPVVRPGLVVEDQPALVRRALADPLWRSAEQLHSLAGHCRQGLPGLCRCAARAAGSAGECRRGDVGGCRKEIHDVHVTGRSWLAPAGCPRESSETVAQTLRVGEVTLADRGRVEVGEFREPTAQPSRQIGGSVQGFPALTEPTRISEVEGDRPRVEPPASAVRRGEPLAGWCG